MEICNEVSCLTLKTKEIALDVDGIWLWFDFAKILKCRDDVYINAAPIAQKFKEEYDKNVKPTLKENDKIRSFSIRNYLKLESTQRYIAELGEIFIINSNSNCHLECQLEAKKAKTKVGATPTFKPKTILAEHGFVYKRKGRYGGTWLHWRLFLNFARWLSPKFEIMCDQILEQVIIQRDELITGRDALKNLQRPLTDAIKLHLVDTGIKTGAVYVHFATQIKRFIGCPDSRDNYTKIQLDAARSLSEEYRAMIVHGHKTSLGEMNKYLKETPLNLAWQKPSA